PHSGEDNPIVFCEGCNAGVHQMCIGIDDSLLESDQPYFCPVCTMVNQEHARRTPASDNGIELDNEAYASAEWPECQICGHKDEGGDSARHVMVQLDTGDW
ncbi:hypothetical protein KIPB_014467, partial [Kipferlia bialata]